jgi:hypothetical protein
VAIHKWSVTVCTKPKPAKKNTSINVPSEWDTIIQMARKKNPYRVIPLRFTDFLDFKKCVKEFLKFQD